jgi:hypothetical protein
VLAEKVNFQGKVASQYFPKCEKQFSGIRQDLDAKKQRRRGFLGDPLHYQDVASLEGQEASCNQVFGQLDQALATCQRNFSQFEDLRRKLLPPDQPWADVTAQRLRNLVRDLEVRHRRLDRELRRVTEAVRTFLAAGTRSYADAYARRLLRHPSEAGEEPGEEREREDDEDLYLSLVCRRAGEQQAEREIGEYGALWEVAGEEVAAKGDSRETIVAVRPREIEPHWYEQLARYYGASAQGLVFSQLEGLVDNLLAPGGQIRIEDQEPLPIGKLLDPKPKDPEGESSWPLVPRQLSEPAETALQAMIALLVALDRLLEAPPLHLQQAAHDRKLQRQRPCLLEALGALHALTDQCSQAENQLHRAIRLHISQGNGQRAYELSQWICRIEDIEDMADATASSLPQTEAQNREESTKKPRYEWRRRLARDFLAVFDIRSAVALVKSERPGKLGVQFQKQPLRIRACLWAAAVFVLAGLAAADWLATHGLPPSLRLPPVAPQMWIIPAAALALLGGPLALIFGAGPRAAWRLLPELLYPRIFMPMVLAVLNLAAIQQTPAMLTSGSGEVKIAVGGLLLLAAGGFLYSRVRQAQRDADLGTRKTLACCFDVFSLAFLEAAALSTVFAVLYEALFEEKVTAPDPYIVFSDIFLRPFYVLSIGALLMFVGIGVQLMFRPEGRQTEPQGSPPSGIGWDLEGAP